MPARPLPTRRHAILACVFAALTALMSAGLVSVAVLIPAPPVVLPVVLLACIGCPIYAAWELPTAIAVLRTPPIALLPADVPEDELVAELRRALDALPETAHPLDL